MNINEEKLTYHRNLFHAAFWNFTLTFEVNCEIISCKNKKNNNHCSGL